MPTRGERVSGGRGGWSRAGVAGEAVEGRLFSVLLQLFVDDVATQRRT